MENSGYTLTWHTNHDEAASGHAVVEYITELPHGQHMLEARCVCGAITKMVSK